MSTDRLSESLKQPVDNEEKKALPRYDLSPDELAILENDLVDLTQENISGETVVAVWINPSSKYANFVRTHEAGYFPEVKEVSEDTEDNTLFLALVDTRQNSQRVVHAATLTLPNKDKSTEKTGFYTVDELISMGNFTLQDFRDYYLAQGIDLDKCLAVETNFRIGERTEKFNGLSATALIYRSLFNRLEQQGAEIDRAVVFATINEPQIRSFERIGLAFEPLMGRNDLKTPEGELGRVSLPVALYYDAKSHELFNSMGKPLPELTA